MKISKVKFLISLIFITSLHNVYAFRDVYAPATFSQIVGHRNLSASDASFVSDVRTQFNDSNGTPYQTMPDCARDSVGNCYSSLDSGIDFTNATAVWFIGEDDDVTLNLFYTATNNNLIRHEDYNGVDPFITFNRFTVDGHSIVAIRNLLSSGNNVGAVNSNWSSFNFLVHNNSILNGRWYGIIATNEGTSTLNITDNASMRQALGLTGGGVATTTHIISFTPNDGDILSATSSVNFTLQVAVAPQDVGSLSTVRITLHNIDQNTLFSSFSTNDIMLVNFVATTSGTFSFSTSTFLDQGNYRVEANIHYSWLSGLLTNPFSSVNQTESHQFIVGSSTYLGAISQKSFSQAQAFYSGLNATDTTSLAQSCNVLSGFDTMNCIAFLFVPSSSQLEETMNTLKTTVLNRPPLGYLNRMYNIWSYTGTSSLPSFNVDIPTGPSQKETISFNMGDMLVGGVAELNSVSSPINNVSVRDVTEPFVKLLIALGAVFTILTDIMGTHKDENKYS